MVEWIASCSILITAVLLLRLIFRNKISKRLQYALWALVVLRLLIPGSIIESAASVGNLLASVTQKPVVQVASGEISSEVRYDLAVQEVLSEHDYPVDAYSALPQQQQEAIVQAYEPQIRQKLDSYEKAYDTAQLLNALWLAGCVVMGLVLLGCNLRFYLKLKQTRNKLPITASLPVYQTAAVQTPCLFGLIRPFIYLPDSAIDEKAMAYILAHEQTHYRHLDHIWSLTRCVCLAVHWYNPLVWIAVRVSRADSELACDEGTLARLGDGNRESYGHALIEMSCARPSVDDYLLTATTMTGDKKSLYQRIQAIAKRQKFILSAVICVLFVALIVTICTFTGTKNDITDPTTETTLSTEATVLTTTSPPATTLPHETTVPPAPKEFPMGTTGIRTSGALRSVTPDMEISCETYPFGGNALLCKPIEGRYQIISLKDGSVLAENSNAAPANSVTVTDDQIIYYSLTARKVFFLNKNLVVVKSVDVPVSNDVSDMFFSQDGRKAYFGTDQHTIVEWNLETNDERVIPVYGPPIWALAGLHFNDSILRFWGKEDGEDYYGFVKLDTGAYLGKDTAMTVLQDWDNNYYLSRGYRGNVERLVVQDGAYKYMIPKDHGKGGCYSTVVPQLNSFFTLSYDYDKTVVVLDLYDLATKQRTSSLTVDLGGEFGSSAKVFADPSGEYIWLCLKVGNIFNSFDMILYRWDFRANAIEDTTVYGYGR